MKYGQECECGSVLNYSDSDTGTLRMMSIFSSHSKQKTAALKKCGSVKLYHPSRLISGIYFSITAASSLRLIGFDR